MTTIEWNRVSTLETEFRTELRHLRGQAGGPPWKPSPPSPSSAQSSATSNGAEIANLETRMQANMQALQTRIILSVGTMMIAAIAAVAAIMRFLA